MILYFDNYITNEPLVKGTYLSLDKIRATNSAYKFRDRLQVAMYTLASYAVLDFSAVVIKYELQDKSKEAQFENFVKGIFPKAIIMRGRSDTQKKFQESVRILKSLKDDWIFYAGNVDHPFVAPDTKTISACLEMAKEAKKTNTFVSVSYSHFPECMGGTNDNSLLYKRYANRKILMENERCLAVLFDNGCFDAIQIVHIDLFERWFCSRDLGSARIIRSEDVERITRPEGLVLQQVTIIPKEEVCAHFDGYSHLAGMGVDNPDSICPPLFLPQGFFENSIKIAYGYDKCREGWVNINPLKRKYSFQDSINGTDLKIDLGELPLFWKNRIKTTDINPACERQAMSKAAAAEREKRINIWPRTPLSTLKFNLKIRACRISNQFTLLSRYSANPDALEARLNVNDSKAPIRKLTYSLITACRKLGIIKKSP